MEKFKQNNRKVSHIDGVRLDKLERVNTVGGDVLHCLKSSDESFAGFGEAYFSTIEYGAVKGWKRHNRMKLNITVPYGEIKFVIYDDREGSETNGAFQEIILSPDKNYQKLSVDFGLWMAFKGISPQCSILLNIIPEQHDDAESDVVDIKTFPYIL